MEAPRGEKRDHGRLIETPPRLPSDVGVVEDVFSPPRTCDTLPDRQTTIAHFNYAPTTKTTVVTTTTTTHISFPPLLLQPPKNLGDLDHKTYPLVHAPTPVAIKNFTFELNGKVSHFKESDTPEQSLVEVCTLLAN